ncbi:MAG: hypothetical protein N2035_02555 [Chthoniobacterales bacterium]|nr:hypothetical protein [Chthoniobacterales bacterium]
MIPTSSISTTTNPTPANTIPYNAIAQQAAIGRSSTSQSSSTPETSTSKWVSPTDQSERIQELFDDKDKEDQKQKVEAKKQYIREFALAELLVLRPEVLKKGSAYLKDPNWPPLNVVNCLATMFIHDFYLNSSQNREE